MPAPGVALLPMFGRPWQRVRGNVRQFSPVVSVQAVDVSAGPAARLQRSIFLIEVEVAVSVVG